MSPYVYAGTFLAAVALGMCAPSWIRARRYAKAETAFWRSLTAYVDRAYADIDQATTNRIDARIESALLDGYATPLFDALVADVCAAAVADVDNEWREVSGA